jgi:hypothetical protein
MTNTYLTGNPLGSTSPKDLFDNASNFDEAMNSPSPAFYDRFQKRRETWAGMEKMVTDFLEAMGFESTHLQYVDGTPLTVLRPTQLINRAPSVYKVKEPATFPVNLTGTWATDQLLLVDVGDAPLRSELADAVSLANGATMVGRATPQIFSLAELKTYEGRYSKDCVLLMGRDVSVPGRGDQHFWWDAASTTTANDFNVVQVTGVPIGRWIAFGREIIRASDWGMYGDGADITTQYAALMAYVALLGSIGKHATIVLGAGNYVKSSCPNHAYRGLVLHPEGEVTYTNTGAGPNMLIDFGALAGMKGDGVYIGSPNNPITFRGGSATGDGIYVRAFVGNGGIAANVHGCGTSARAFRSEWSVLIDYWLNITPGDLSTGSLAWYLGGVPSVGISLGERLSGEQTAYCQFWNPKANGCNVGVFLESTLGNNLWGGDAEFSISTGLLATVNALKDKIWGMNFEVNPNDINCVANGIRFIGCDAVNFTIGATAVNCKMIGCLTDGITVVLGAVGTLISDTSFSRGISSTVIVDAGTETRHSNNYNMTTNKFQNAPQIVMTPAVSFPGGVFTWTNTTGDTVLVQGTGGTISNVSVGSGGDIATIPYPMNRIAILNGEPIAFTGSGALVFKVWRGV